MNERILNKASARTHWLSKVGIAAVVVVFAGCASWEVNDPRLGQSLAAAKEAQRSFKRDGGRDVTSKELRPASDRHMSGEDSLTTREDVKSLVRQR